MNLILFRYLIIYLKIIFFIPRYFKQTFKLNYQL